MTVHRLRWFLDRLLLPVFAIAMVGCEADPVMEPDTTPEEPALEGEALAFEPVTVANFEERLGEATIRLEIEFYDEGLTAKEVEIESDDELADEEEIRSRITELALEGVGGVITLELGGLQVSFDSDTRYRLAGGDDIDMASFIERVQSALADGAHPPVKAERDPPAGLQDPSDGSFHADELRLDADLDQPEIEVNVNQDNLVRNDAPPPDGWIRVLGLEIELRVSEGLTEIESERPDIEIEDFEGIVVAVDLDAGTFTLADGTIVQMIPQTELMDATDASRYRLRRLAAVQEALDEGLTIIAFGHGVVQSRSPLFLIALRVGFEVDRSTIEEWEGVIASVDVGDRSFTLEDGTVIQTIGLTTFAHTDHWEMNDDLLTRVAEAIANGAHIVAGGLGVLVSEDPPQIVALRAKFGIQPTPFVEFEGLVVEVDLEEETFTLEDGTLVHLPANDDGPGLRDDTGDDYDIDLEDIAEAIEAGVQIIAFGIATVESEDPRVLVAKRLFFVVDRSTLEEYEGVVVDVDLEARTFTLEGGRVVAVIGLTDLAHGDDLDGDGHDDDVLERIASAVEAGQQVIGHGLAVAAGDGPPQLIAIRARFGVQPVPFVEFEGRIAEVDVEGANFTLDDGTVVHMPAAGSDEGGLTDEGDHHLDGLAQVARALENGLVVIAFGHARVESEDPPVLAAVRVRFVIDRATLEEFEGAVASVDVEGGSFTLEDGTIIRTLGFTHFTNVHDWEHSDNVLARVAEAIENGARVIASGLGVVVEDDPLTLIALKLRFEVAPPPVEEFEGVVASVDVEGGSFTLENGTIVQLPTGDGLVTATTDAVHPIHRNLAAVAEALEAGLTVFAHGAGFIVDEDPLTIVALRLHFELGEEGAVQFEGAVAAVDLENRNFTLEDGTVVWVLGLTSLHVEVHHDANLDGVVDSEDGHPFLSPLHAIARGLEAGLLVHAAGLGAVKSDDPLELYGIHVEFVIELPAQATFEGVVESVDLEAHSFTLADGTVVLWPLADAAGNLDANPRLEAVHEALEAGLVVIAAGAGFVVTEDPLVIAALHVEFGIDREGAEQFEGTVASVDLAAKLVLLEDGTAIQIVAMTEVGFDDEGGAEGLLERVVAALGEFEIHAAGVGILVGTEPNTYVAIEVHFDKR